MARYNPFKTDAAPPPAPIPVKLRASGKADKAAKPPPDVPDTGTFAFMLSCSVADAARVRADFEQFYALNRKSYKRWQDAWREYQRSHPMPAEQAAESERVAPMPGNAVVVDVPALRNDALVAAAQALTDAQWAYMAPHASEARDQFIRWCESCLGVTDIQVAWKQWLAEPEQIRRATAALQSGRGGILPTAKIPQSAIPNPKSQIPAAVVIPASAPRVESRFGWRARRDARLAGVLANA